MVCDMLVTMKGYCENGILFSLILPSESVLKFLVHRGYQQSAKIVSGIETKKKSVKIVYGM